MFVNTKIYISGALTFSYSVYTVEQNTWKLIGLKQIPGICFND